MELNHRRAERQRPVISVTFGDHVLEALDAECERIGCTRAAAVEAAVKMWMEALPEGTATSPSKNRGGQLPYGKARVAGEIVDVPDEVETIAMVKRLRQDGHSMRTISKMLAEAGWMARNGKPFLVPQIARILEMGQGQ